MKRFEAVIQSEAAPSTSSLWLNNNKIWYFDGEWKAVEGSYNAAEFFNLGKIDVTTLPKTISITNSIEMNKFKKAISLAFEADNGNAFIDNMSMNQVSVNTITKQRIYTSPNLICAQDQDWNYIKATATSSSNKIDIYLEKI